MNESEFYKNGEEMLMEMLEEWPVNATYMGIHKWDDRLGDFSLASQTEFNKKVNGYLNKLNSINTESYSKDAKIDYEILKQLLKQQTRDFEIDKDHLRNPNHYMGAVFNGIMSLIIKDFAPIEERLNSLLGRLKEIPEILAAGEDILEAAKVPEVWIDITLQQTQMAPGLFKGLLPALAENAPDIKEEIIAEANKAAEAVESYGEFLKNEVKPAADGEFAVGVDGFNTRLKEDHMVDYNQEELLEIGWEIFNDTKEKMEKLAAEIDSEKTVREILNKAKQDHPSADKLLDKYRSVMAETKKFVKEHDIATIPENEKLTIIETPAYMRPIIPFAAYMQPGIFEKELEGLFLVTPVNPDAPEKEKEEKLKAHPNGKLPVTTLHEGYPGHHLQLVWAVTCGTTIRKLGMMVSTLFVEGWAFYCEELMEELGYIDEPIQKLSRLNDQLWRAARIILDVSLHCRGMSVDEAVDFLVEECSLEKADAVAEVKRYTTSPTQPQSYLMGKREIISIIEKYKEKNPDKSMKEIHDSILACGSLPPKLMKKQLFE
ncbi:MAG: DUF885 domain-containing protein [Halothermotrichaceae bacterium]